MIGNRCDIGNRHGDPLAIYELKDRQVGKGVVKHRLSGRGNVSDERKEESADRRPWGGGKDRRNVRDVKDLERIGGRRYHQVRIQLGKGNRIVGESLGLEQSQVRRDEKLSVKVRLEKLNIRGCNFEIHIVRVVEITEGARVITGQPG